MNGAPAGRFVDRRDAGRRLADALAHLRDAQPLVLALPRGGVPVAFEIAMRLAAPLDLVLVRKIGAPGFEELALGAVVDGAAPQLHFNEALLRQFAPPASWVERQVRDKLDEIERRRERYLGGRPAPQLGDRCVIVVDDGVATGATVRAAIRAMRNAMVRRLILAVPVGAAEVLAALDEEVDELLSLLRPADFQAVGAYYADFTQTSDDEVVHLLAAAAAP